MAFKTEVIRVDLVQQGLVDPSNPNKAAMDAIAARKARNVIY